MKIKFTENELSFINKLKYNKYFNNIDDIFKLSKDEIIDLINNYLVNQIGYDELKGDIDDIGLIADEIISKLLILLRQRNEM